MEEAHAAFKESDRNNSGYIDYVELRGALGRILDERAQLHLAYPVRLRQRRAPLRRRERHPLLEAPLRRRERHPLLEASLPPQNLAPRKQ